MQAGKGLCKHAAARKVTIKNSPVPFLSAMLIALIPKCPFCMLAYSLAITVCSAKAITHTPVWTSFISISLALATLLIVVYNYRGRRTLAAAALVLLGTAFISYSELYSGNITHYYMGCMVLVVGVWANGSFLFFVKLLRSKFSKQIGGLPVHG